MFTGIVVETGVVRAVQRIRGGLGLTVAAERALRGLQTGDSIAIDGVCQTVVALGDDIFSVQVLPETLGRTTLGRRRRGDRVNLELAVAPDDRFGGHLITGHVDGLGIVRARRPRTGDTILKIGAPAGIMAQLVERGSVAVDGVSLTVVSLSGSTFTVALIPHTLQNTTLAGIKVGDRVNLETDLIVKAVHRWLDRARSSGELTKDRLRQLGF